MGAYEQRTTRSAQSVSHSSRQQLRLIEPALASPDDSRGYPCHDVHIARVDEHRHLERQPSQRRARVAVLQSRDELASRALVRENGTADVDSGRR